MGKGAGGDKEKGLPPRGAPKTLLLKDSYWRWPERNLAGNAIDFCVQVLGLSFHDAMRALLHT